ncbi:hypothetical protein INT45_003061 [Circinella minor]|uniref:SH3 domain-containing protein n=1 Tax=Circinella minor TaxID=1195481 RepID=A0A8H7RZN8_9FUNG|nr:hypothetical protein INT45_003061 [Circinella minor]
MKYPHLNVMDELKTVKVTHDFIGENEDEISLKKGEHVIVIEKDDEFQDGWWRGRNAHGEVGLFPMNYVLELPVKQQVSPPPVSSLEQKIDTLEDTLSAMQLTNTTTTITNSSNVLTTTTSSPLLSSIKSRRSSTYSSRSNTSAQTSNSNNNNNNTNRIGSVSKPNIQQVIVNSMTSPILSDTPPEEWTIGQVASWLDIIGFKDIIDSFKDQEITGDVLLELTQQSLKELGIGTFGKRYKLHSAIQSLKEEASRRDQIMNDNPDILPQHQVIIKLLSG